MKHEKSWIGFVWIVIVVVVLGGCGSTAAAASGDLAQGNNARVEAAASDVEFEEVSAQVDLSEEEIAGLLYMREEEKLAHDVYVALYEQWGLPIFDNIAASEQTHTEAALRLLDHYGLADPAAGRGEGEFADPTLQGLYDRLVAQGSASLEEALRVGAAIEEIDILDLETHLAQTERSDMRQVYENLLKGSSNHLRSFARTLGQQTGETYAPQYLDQEAYDAIISSGGGRGGGGSAGNTGAGSGRGGAGRGGQGQGLQNGGGQGRGGRN